MINTSARSVGQNSTLPQRRVYYFATDIDSPLQMHAHPSLLEHLPPYKSLWARVFKKENDGIQDDLSSGSQYHSGAVS
jgi:hypothetical protein